MSPKEDGRGGRRGSGAAGGRAGGNDRSAGRRGVTRGRPAGAGAERSAARRQPPARQQAGRGSGGRPEIDGGEQVEGRQAVRELLRAGRRRVHYLLLAETLVHSELLDEVVALAETAGVPVRRVTRERVDAAALTDAPQGIVAFADAFPAIDIDELLVPRTGGAAPFLVVLDGVTDPHNVGAVMRSALSAGATGMVIGRHRAATISPTTTKAAAGAVEWLPLALVAGVPGALSQLKDAGVWTVGLDTEGSTSVWDLEVATEPIALVLGAEGTGLSRLARQRCDVVASIPMQGPLGSLNVSAAAAIGCFEITRRRGGNHPPS